MNILKAPFCLAVLFLAMNGSLSSVSAQDPASSESGSSPQNEADSEHKTQPAESESSATDGTAPSMSQADVAEKARELASRTQSKVEEIADTVDQNPTAKKAAEGILGPLYVLAETLSFPAFHWLAFGLMAAGVVSFALQLVLGKLVVLFRGSFNIREILSDLVGLVISAVGLVLTTQAAAENSTFTHSAAAVLSSAAAGIAVGFTLYRWGQAQEIQAVDGRRAAGRKD